MNTLQQILALGLSASLGALLIRFAYYSYTQSSLLEKLYFLNTLFYSKGDYSDQVVVDFSDMRPTLTNLDVDRVMIDTYLENKAYKQLHDRYWDLERSRKRFLRREGLIYIIVLLACAAGLTYLSGSWKEWTKPSQEQTQDPLTAEYSQIPDPLSTSYVNQSTNQPSSAAASAKADPLYQIVNPFRKREIE